MTAAHTAGDRSMEADASAVSPEELAARAATLDELLSDDFQSLPGLSAIPNARRNVLPHGVTRAVAATGSCSIDG